MSIVRRLLEARDSREQSMIDEFYRSADLQGVNIDVEPLGDNEVHLVWVDRGRAEPGQGATVIRHLLRLADKYGVKVLGQFYATDERLGPYYERLGFEITGTDPEDDDDDRMTTFEYTPRLSEAPIGNISATNVCGEKE